MADQLVLHAEEVDAGTTSEENQIACDTPEDQVEPSKSAGESVTEGTKLNDADTAQKIVETDEDENGEDIIGENKKSEKLLENDNDVNGTPTRTETAEGKISTDSSCKQDENTHDYELINGQYYYTDKSSGTRYKYEEKEQEWIEVMQTDEPTVSDSPVVEGTQSDADTQHKSGHATTTDSEGRTYYYADNYYLCQDQHGNVFYLNDKNEWTPWGENDSKQSSESSKWYFCQGESKFYRDNVSGVVYKFDKENNKWEKYEGKLKKKRPRVDEEEFDTDEEDSDEEEFGSGLMPPGAKDDPNISYDGTTYTKVDPVDKVMYEWDTDRRAWFPKVRSVCNLHIFIMIV